MIWLRKGHFSAIITFITLIAISVFYLRLNLGKISDISNAIDFILGWFPPNANILKSSFLSSITTLSIAFLGTIISILISLPISFVVANNTNSSILIRQSSRFFLSLMRAVPEFILGLVFLTILGTGATAAVIAIILHNIGVFAKKISELIEASEPGPFIAVQSVGASHASACCFGILPQILPNIISEYFYRFEVAFRASLVLGIIGGGGIGQQLMNHFQTFQYKSVCTDLIIIIFFVFLVDYLSQYLRKKII
jgi:phosphonate transport system permease protein